MLLPVIERENADVPKAFRNVAEPWDFMWKVNQMKSVLIMQIAEIEKLSTWNIRYSKKVTELGIEEKDFDFEYLSKNALIDACQETHLCQP